MKKFLTVLLVIAVMFTFSFSSAFAYTGSGYDKADALELLGEAYSAAVPTEFKVDYDTVNSTANDFTVFTVGATHVRAGIYKAYTDAADTISKPETTEPVTTIAGVALASGETRAQDLQKVTFALAAAGGQGGAQDATTLASAFDEYKAHLTSLVNAVSTADYTTTSYEDLGVSKFRSVDGNDYSTSKEAAEADKKWALAAIAKAKFDTTVIAKPAATDKEWTTDSYADLYTKVILKAFQLVENKDDVLDSNKVTSVSYKCQDSRNYSTTAAEQGSAATLEAKKALAKAKVLEMVATYQNSGDYKASQANALAAFQEAINYLIDAATKEAELPDAATIGTTINTVTDTTVTTDKPYTLNSVAAKGYAAQAKDDAASNKQLASIMGRYYDDAKADAALKAVLCEIYKGETYAKQEANGKKLYNGYLALTPGEKAKLKAEKDYSDVEADAKGQYTFKTYNTGTLADAVYYAKEFEAVKAAADAYCKAIDEAKTVLDVEKAEDAYKEATLEKNIKKAASVDSIFAGYTNGLIQPYVANTVGKSGTTPIYVTWDGGESYKTYTAAPSTENADYKAFVIAKGARTTAEADALYPEACALIDAYKTRAQLTSEATAVQTKIAALPANPTLADKAAVMEAYKAYKALPASFQNYVSNAAKLKDAVKAVERLEAIEVVKLINALPANISVADKAAVKAASDAYDAYNKEAAYKDTSVVLAKSVPSTATNKLDAAKKAVKDAQLREIKKSLDLLQVKYLANKLTAADAPAIEALQKAVDEYIAEYKEAVDGEDILAIMAEAVATDKAAEVLKVKITASSKATKGAITVKWTIKGKKSACKGFQVWRSTKKNTGFKKMITTSKYSYKNTKSLKKGVRYYYKVRAYNRTEDGKLVFSDWSNKAYRIAK